MERGTVSSAWVLWGVVLCACSGGSGAHGSTGSTTGTADPAEGDVVEDAGPPPLEMEPIADAAAPLPPPPEVDQPPPLDPDDFVSTLPPLAPGEPIDAQPNTWTWVPVPEARCQRDDATGMHFNLGDPEKLVILMEGGGACYNAGTCALSLAIHPFGATALDTPAVAQVYGTNLFNRDDPDNPVRDFSFVFFPYCSGDVFAGASQNAAGYEGRTQQGYYNVRAYLRRLIATFPQAKKVLLTGVSAGGFGAGFNFDQVQEAFGHHTRVYLLDDSGPPMSTEQMPPCLQERWRDAWSLDDIMPDPALCPGCRNPQGDVGMMAMVGYLAKKYPTRRLALISAVHDGVIREFFGFGLQDCKNLDPPLNIPQATTPVAPDVYERGLHQLLAYAESMGGATMKGFLVPDSETHTFLIAPGTFKNTVVDGMPLGLWLKQLIEDDPAWDHAGVH
jgi:hypothetical protein